MEKSESVYETGAKVGEKMAVKAGREGLRLQLLALIVEM